VVELVAPNVITVGEPFLVAFEAQERVAGRLRITAGTEAIEFTLVREGREPARGTAHRVRGRSGSFQVRDWGEHAPGSELVLRFEGAKVWMTVQA
jgi:hypothetical protein